MRFLKPKSWDPGEKLYELEYNPSDGLAERNYDTHQIYDIPIHDLRPLKGKLSLDREGFVILDLPSSMKYEDYLDETKLKSVFAEELRQCLLNTLGARAVFIHECVVCAQQLCGRASRGSDADMQECRFARETRRASFEEKMTKATACLFPWHTPVSGPA